MMRWSVGLLCLAWSLVATQVLAQAPQPAPASDSNAAFPAAEPSPPPPAAAAPPAATPPAVATAPAPAAAPPAVSATPTPVAYNEPPPPPPRETDLRPIRLRRPFFIGGELGWNGLAGLGVNFSYHPIPYFAMDTGLGLALTGLRLGVRARANLLTGEWTPFLAAGITYSNGTGGKTAEIQSKGEKAEIEVLASPYVQFAGGVNYTGSEGFVFMATTGYALLLEKNTRFVSGDLGTYNDQKGLFKGGLILSVAFGYAF